MDQIDDTYADAQKADQNGGNRGNQDGAHQRVPQDDDPSSDAKDAGEQFPAPPGTVDKDADDLEDALDEPIDTQQLNQNHQSRLGRS